MGANMEFYGLDELREKLESMTIKASGIENKALKKAAQPILDDMKSTTAFKDDTGKLRRSLAISRVRMKNHIKYVSIGIDRKEMPEVYYGFFVEFGTSQKPARPFIAPAYERHKREAIEIIAQEMRRAMR